MVTSQIRCSCVHCLVELWRYSHRLSDGQDDYNDSSCLLSLRCNFCLMADTSTLDAVRCLMISTLDSLTATSIGWQMALFHFFFFFLSSLDVVHCNLHLCAGASCLKTVHVTSKNWEA